MTERQAGGQDIAKQWGSFILVVAGGGRALPCGSCGAAAEAEPSTDLAAGDASVAAGVVPCWRSVELGSISVIHDAPVGGNRQIPAAGSAI